MRRLAACAWLSAIAIAALTLYQMKHEVRSLEEALAQENRAVLGNQEAIHVLNAEWSYLNRPARIAELSERLLSFGSLEREQIVEIDAVPKRETDASEAAAPLAASLAGTGQSQ